MPKREKFGIAFILVLVCTLTIFDLVDDGSEGVVWWHLGLEAMVLLAAIFGLFLLLKGTVTLKQRLNIEQALTSQHRDEALAWRKKAKTYLLGLSQEIERQLSEWKLSKSEKEVAFLLLKGYSLKEIAAIRNTSEKTARVQSTAIYAKAGLSGRSQLAAFFLEDLLLPEEDRTP